MPACLWGWIGMTTVKLARKYNIDIFQLQNIIVDLRTRGYEFTRKGKKYDFSKEDLEIIEAELERRGYVPKNLEPEPVKDKIVQEKPAYYTTPSRIMRQYKISPYIMYNVLLSLHVRGYAFTKYNGKYTITPEEEEIIAQELERRGYRKDSQQ